MYHYLKAIEDLNNIRPNWAAHDVIGKIKSLKLPELSFTLYAEDTDISFDCILSKSVELNTRLKTGDCIIVDGHYIDDKLIVYSINKAPFDLTGSMDKDSLVLINEAHSINSVQFQNGYITSEEYEKLQKAWLNYRDIYHSRAFFRKIRKYRG